MLMSLGERLTGKTVTHRTDDTNVEHNLNVGSPKPKLHLEAIAIYTLCRQIHLEPKWIPRKFNQEADDPSRLASKDDYMLNPNIYAALNLPWGPHTIDHFSTFRTHQIPFLFSREWCLHTFLVRREQLDLPSSLLDIQGTAALGAWYGVRHPYHRTSASWWPLVT